MPTITQESFEPNLESFSRTSGVLRKIVNKIYSEWE